MGLNGAMEVPGRVLLGVLSVAALWLVVRLLRRRLAGTGRRRSSVAGWVSRGGIGRNAVAGLVATGADYVLFRLLLDLADAPPPLATFCGCTFGAVVNFSINRLWAFRARGPVAKMAGRYLLVSAASALFNSLGVAALLLIPGLGASVAWLFARVWIFVELNYPLHRDYVFSTGVPSV